MVDSRVKQSPVIRLELLCGDAQKYPLKAKTLSILHVLYFNNAHNLLKSLKVKR